jgi:hypothetical protein
MSAACEAPKWAVENVRTAEIVHEADSYDEAVTWIETNGDFEVAYSKDYFIVEPDVLYQTPAVSVSIN